LNLLFLCSPKEKVAKRKGVFPPHETSMFQAAAAARPWAAGIALILGRFFFVHESFLCHEKIF